MASSLRLCIAINKEGGRIGDSESFLHAHLERLPGIKFPLIGTPGTRRVAVDRERFLLSRSKVARAYRKARRLLTGETVHEQDTRSLVRFLERERIDVVLGEYGPTALSVQHACSLAGVPLVSHFHGWDAYVLAADPANVPKYQELFRQSAAIVAVSRHMREHLIQLGASPEQVVWNPCGAEANATSTANPAESPPVFLSIGRPTPKKALIVTLLAFAKVRRKITTARLEIIGAELDALTEQTLRALGILDSVTFLGALPHDQVLGKLSRVRCYVHPSVTAPNGDMEGTPVSVLEAMAAGLPVVATRHGGMIDILNGSGAGLLVDEYDVDATAEAMLIYAQSTPRAAQDGARGHLLLRERWSMERSIGTLAQVIEATSARDWDGLRDLALVPT